MTTDSFNALEWQRYTRHIQLPQIGASGQTKLKASHALIVGCGGLGSPVSLYLAAAGVGTITLVDGDSVDLTNLQRQIVFSTEQVGQSKALSTKERLEALNDQINVKAITEHFTLANANELISQADLVLDCTDNFATRYLINDMCTTYKKPWVFASIHQFSGQCALFTPETACFRCLFPESPSEIPDCNAAGVLGVLPGMLGLFQANEAIKYLVGLDTPLKNILLIIEALDLTFRKIKLSKSNECVVCQHHKKPIQLSEFYQFACASDNCDPCEISCEQFEELRVDKSYCLLDVRTDAERSAFHIGGQHIPLNELPDRLNELNIHQTIVCYCQSGIRSLKAANLLAENNFEVKSLHKGLAQWVKEFG